MPVNLEAIHLNHDPSSTTTGAFSIRRNERVPIRRPEWLRHISVRPEDAPAAYAYELAKNIGVTIEAAFSCTGPPIPKIRVRALDEHLHPKKDSLGSRLLQLLSPSARDSVPSNVLGNVAEGDVTFEGGKGKATLFLENVKIRDVGVGVSDVIWRWQYSLDGKDWIDLTTSLHRIYTVVEMPTPPWQPKSKEINDTQLPWAEVLDFACRIAIGTKSLDEAATKITQWANGLGKQKLIKYDQPGGWPAFIEDSPRSFDCSDFLLLLNGGPNLQGSEINCDDCSAIVTSFSNVLGCRLSEGKMGGLSFDLKPHLRIGLDPVFESNFGGHRVGWLGECTEIDPLFDACVQLDLDDDPTTKIFTVPTNIKFIDYRPRLTTEEDNCKALGKLPVMRMGLPPLRKIPKADALLRDSEISSATTILSRVEQFPDLRLIDFRFSETTPARYLLQFFLRQRNDLDVSFGTKMYESALTENTQALVQNILNRFNQPPQKIPEPPFGTEAYASENRSVILFVRDVFVFLIRNTGKKSASCEELAKLIDRVIVEMTTTTEKEK